VNNYSYYDKTTGLFTGKTFSTTDETAAHAARQAPDKGVVKGHHDKLSKKVDLATGKVVDYVPPAPSAEETKTIAKGQALKLIAQLEASSGRLVRQALLNVPGALAKLAALEDRVLELEKI
jgi:hypothetical protein